MSEKLGTTPLLPGSAVYDLSTVRHEESLGALEPSIKIIRICFYSNNDICFTVPMLTTAQDRLTALDPACSRPFEERAFMRTEPSFGNLV